MTYGVQSTGYVRKPFAQILSDLQQANIATFGPDVVQTAQSPLGQINALMADLINEMWELGEQVYVAHDPDQAEGSQLDRIGAIRGLTRSGGISDAVYRRTITNSGQASVAAIDALAAVTAVDGVSWASVIENSTHAFDPAGLPPHSLAFAVIGGADDDVATAIYNNTVSGVGLYGFDQITTTIDGYCRQILLTRPTDVLVSVELDIRPLNQTGDCSGASAATIIASVVASAYSDWVNGQTITPGHLQSYVGEIGGLELVEGRIARIGETPIVQDLSLAFNERPALVAENLAVRFV